MKKSRRLSSVDVIIVMIILITAIAGVFLMNTFNHEGFVVKVSQQGAVIKDMFLDNEVTQKLVVESENGGKNVVLVKHGYAYVESATCDDKVCVKKGRISKVGESIVCLPNDVVVEIVEDNSIEESPF